jgi:hypothetical protein
MVAVFVPALSIGIAVLPAMWVFAAGALVSTALSLYIWAHLPLAFELVTSTPASAAHWPDFSLAPKRFVWLPILRSLYPLPLLAVFPVFVIEPGRVAGIICILPAAIAMMRLSWVATLPIRRGALLAIVLLPGLFLGQVALLFHDFPAPIYIKWSDDGHIAEIRPPLEFWHTGASQRVTAPWGESWRPVQETLHGVAVYNPFSFGPQSSERFIDWQTGRLTQILHFDRFDIGPNGGSRIWVQSVTRTARFTLLYAAIFAVWPLLMVNVGFAGAHWRLTRLPGLAANVPIVGSVLLMLHWNWPLAQIVTDPLKSSLTDALALRLAAALPSNLWIAALIAFAPAALLWWTALRLFAGIEVSPWPGDKT